MPPYPRGSAQEQSLMPVGDRRSDPFSQFDDMFAGPSGSLMGFGGFGGSAGLFGMMDQMMQGMGEVSAGSGGSGGFSSSTMMMSMNVGPDGQVHTEKFASSSVGDRDKRIAETQQAYSNSSTGVDKMSLERQMQDRGRKMVKERINGGDERQTEMFRGFDESQAHEFDQQWQQHAAPHLRNHFSGVPQLMAAPQRVPEQLTNAPQYAAAPQLTNAPHTRPTYAAPTGLPHARTSQAPAASQHSQYSSAPRGQSRPSATHSTYRR